MQIFLSESNVPSPLLSKRLVYRVPTRERQSENIRRVNEVLQIAHMGDLAMGPRKVRVPPLLVPKTPTKQVIPGWSTTRNLSPDHWLNPDKSGYLTCGFSFVR